MKTGQIPQVFRGAYPGTGKREICPPGFQWNGGIPERRTVFSARGRMYTVPIQSLRTLSTSSSPPPPAIPNPHILLAFTLHDSMTGSRVMQA